MTKIKTFILLAVCAVGIFVSSNVAVKAQTEDTTDTTTNEESEYQLPEPTIYPDSPFYFLSRLSDRVGMFFAFSAEAKVNRSISIGEKRLAEAQAMAEKGKDDLAAEAAQEYGKMIGNAAGILSQTAKEGGDIDEALENLVDRSTSIHQQVLTDVYESVPEEAKQSIQSAMEESSRGQSEALEAVSGEKRQEIMERIQRKREELQQQLPSQAPEGVGPGSESEDESQAPSIPQESGEEQGPPVDIGEPETDSGEPETDSSGAESASPQAAPEVIPGR